MASVVGNPKTGESISIEFFLSDNMKVEVDRLAALVKSPDPLARLSAKAISTAIIQKFNSHNTKI